MILLKRLEASLKLASCLAFLCLSVSSADAYEQMPDGNVGIHVYMSLTCSDFLQTYADEQAARARVSNPPLNTYYNNNFATRVFFIAGMMTGTNRGRPGKADFFYKSLDTAVRKVKAYCEASPEQSLFNAVTAMETGDK
ncbi:hypothetical protein [Aureimonas psammosilenae]|uniref:hypothetical protein n=1 Tax=Aureimonas psammosilenae TaxID=2495496 RepID=UPI00126063F6|nr:hypothetical protein [Aureimonas psammosilenae]